MRPEVVEGRACVVAFSACVAEPASAISKMSASVRDYLKTKLIRGAVIAPLIKTYDVRFRQQL